jgi:uncharacterized membrane protein
MVTKTETTEIVTEPKLHEVSQPSLKRWLKHFFFMPATKRYFSKADQQAIALAVKQAEQGHIGEIQVVIEGHIPASQAYHQNTLHRARQLFAELGVWDTELNSGVLIYLNLCEKKVEIVIDRGIKNATEQAVWNEICLEIAKELSSGQYRLAMVNGVIKTGEILDLFYANKYTDSKNELGNSPILLG